MNPTTIAFVQARLAEGFPVAEVAEAAGCAQRSVYRIRKAMHGSSAPPRRIRVEAPELSASEQRKLEELRARLPAIRASLARRPAAARAVDAVMDADLGAASRLLEALRSPDALASLGTWLVDSAPDDADLGEKIATLFERAAKAARKLASEHKL